MNELSALSKQLPDTVEDIAKFILIGSEKMKAVKAEIRAIEKLHLAKEVYSQKMDEQRLLAELILDAQAKLGEFSKQIPKQSGGDRRSEDFKSFQEKTLKGSDSAILENLKTKVQTMADLGFTKKQTHEFEALADNKDLVEQVKQEARENDDIPTRSRVLDLAQQRKKKEAEEKQISDDYYKYMDECKALSDKYHKAIYAFLHIKADEKEFKMLSEIILPTVADSYLYEVDDSIRKLAKLRNFLKGVKK